MSDHTGDGELQFETVMPPPLPGSVTAPAGVSCVVCQAGIPDEYLDVNGQTVCGDCRTRVLSEAETPKGWSVLLRAMACGAAAAIAGAILYYAVIAITNFEIGILAIAIGYMVGYGVRFGASGRGGRRFQVMAVLLTYLAVSLAYSVLAIRASFEEPATETANSTALTPAPSPPAVEPPTGAEAQSASASEEEPSAGSAALGLVFLLGFCLAMPVIVVASSLPGGLLSAAIIAFGMQQAWKMTMAPVLNVSGPYRVGMAAPAVAAV